MIFIIGGAYQGKLAFAVSLWKKLYEKEPEVCSEFTKESLKKADIIPNLHLYIKRRIEMLYEMEYSVQDSFSECFCAKQLLQEILSIRFKKPNIIFTMAELGCGIVPIQPEDRRYREICGRISCVLSMLSEQTWKITCGIEILMAEHDFLTVALIRHGKTQGNIERRYIGQTDESLCEEGIAEINHLRSMDNMHMIQPDILFSSPFKRCLETAALLFPNLSPIQISQLYELNFGKFEGKNCEELNQSPELSPLWQDWIDSQGTLPFPDGESLEEFVKRTTNGFSETIESLLSDMSAKASRKMAAFILHGGSIMAILDTYVPKDYFHYHDSFYSWQVKNGDGYLLLLDKKAWITGKRNIYPIQQLSYLWRDIL